MGSKSVKTVRQERIIECARRIIFLKGVEKLTTRQIGKELKLTNGALYRHFKSKEEVMSLLVDDIEMTLLNSIKEAAAEKKTSLEKLENIFLSHLSHAESVKGTSIVIINKVSSIKDKKLQKKTLNLFNNYLKIIEHIIIEGIKSGEFRRKINPASASLVFLGALQSIVTVWSLGDYKGALKNRDILQAMDIFKSWISQRES